MPTLPDSPLSISGPAACLPRVLELTSPPLIVRSDSPTTTATSYKVSDCSAAAVGNLLALRDNVPARCPPFSISDKSQMIVVEVEGGNTEKRSNATS